MTKKYELIDGEFYYDGELKTFKYIVNMLNDMQNIIDYQRNVIVDQQEKIYRLEDSDG